jgi:hypothetical protein
MSPQRQPSPELDPNFFIRALQVLLQQRDRRFLAAKLIPLLACGVALPAAAPGLAGEDMAGVNVFLAVLVVFLTLGVILAFINRLMDTPE